MDVSFWPEPASGGCSNGKRKYVDPFAEISGLKTDLRAQLVSCLLVLNYHSWTVKLWFELLMVFEIFL